MFHKIDTVLLDFDGTLVEIDIDFAEMRRGVIALGLEYGVSPEPGLYVLESLEDIFRKLLLRYAVHAQEFRERAEKLIVDIELEAAAGAKVIPGAAKALGELKARGFGIGIITRNCRLAVVKSAEVAGLVFDLVLTRDDVKNVKPDPRHLLDALAMLDSRPETALMVGNHPLDIVAGKKAGTKTAAVLTSNSREDFEEVAPDLILGSVAELLEIL